MNDSYEQPQTTAVPTDAELTIDLDAVRLLDHPNLIQTNKQRLETIEDSDETLLRIGTLLGEANNATTNREQYRRFRDALKLLHHLEHNISILKEDASERQLRGVRLPPKHEYPPAPDDLDQFIEEGGVVDGMDRYGSL